MTPKEKARELVDKYATYVVMWKGDINSTHQNCKQCALIAVDEIIKSGPLEPNDSPEWLQPEDWFPNANIYAEKYWQEVKQEIENL